MSFQASGVNGTNFTTAYPISSSNLEKETLDFTTPPNEFSIDELIAQIDKFRSTIKSNKEEAEQKRDQMYSVATNVKNINTESLMQSLLTFSSLPNGQTRDSMEKLKSYFTKYLSNLKQQTTALQELQKLDNTQKKRKEELNAKIESFQTEIDIASQEMGEYLRSLFNNISVQKMDQNTEKMHFRFEALQEEYKKRGFNFHV